MKQFGMRCKVFLIVMTCVLLPLTVGTALSSHFYKRILQREFDTRARIVAENFATAISEDLLLQDEPAIRTALQLVLLYQDVVFAALYDANGIPLGFDSQVDVAVGRMLSTSQSSRQALTSKGQEVLEVTMPVHDRDDETVGVIRLLFSLSRLDRQIAHISRLIFGGYVVILLLVSSLGAFLADRYLSQPIMRLGRLVHNISEGQYQQRISLNAGREINALAEGVNTMSEKITQHIAEIHDKEEQLRHSQRMDAIGQIAGGVAHDFNNMLGGIIGAAELLGTRLPDDEKARKYHELIVKSAQQAASLTQKLLTFARKQPQASLTFDIHDSIKEMTSLLGSTIDRRIRVETKLEAKPSLVEGDPAQLQNAFLNLGLNASHAMPDGGLISISSQTVDLDEAYCRTSHFHIEPGTYVQVEIRDTGCGIPPENLQRIFEPFFTTRERGKGTGLGLAAVYGTVKQHHGAINVYSEVGRGTSFHILLPLSGATTPEPVVPPTVQPGHGRILVVDDEDVMRDTARAILEDLGYEVQDVEDGLQALEMFAKAPESIDLVLLDMIMPRMNGHDCFLELKKIKPEVKVVVSSGFSRDEDLASMRANGLCGFIRKPYHRAELSQVVHRALA
jgi:signal transduction histidine kinase